jgi:phenylacetate-CoA ligase
MNARLLLYLALQRALGSHAGARYRDFLRWETLTPEVLQQETAARLRAALAHAVREIPFYRERVPGAAPELADFPVLTKADVRTHFAALTHPAHAATRRYGAIEVKTGGSTGEPTTVIHDAAFRDAGRASRLYSQRLCGFPFGTPFHRLWGSMADIHQMRQSPAARLTAWLGRETLWNAFRLSDADCAAFLADLRRRSARHVMAYVDAIDQVARYAESHGGAPPLISIMACAGTVTPDTHDRLARVFGARVHNKYGSRECTDLACACAHGGLHVYTPHVVLEIVDDAGAPCAPGVTGRVLVTLPGNATFPLIRYEIGDVAAWAEPGPCPCGRPFPRLRHIEGRAVEFLRAADGAYVSPVYIRHLIGVVHNPGALRRFQLTQHDAVRFTLLVEPDPAATPGALEAARPLIERDLRAVLGAAARIEWRAVEHIPESASGKFLYVLNETETPRTGARSCAS